MNEQSVASQARSLRIFDGAVPSPAGCPRNRNDCAATSRIASPDYTSFMCCGETTPESRSVAGDIFRLCIKSTHKTGVDLLVNLDKRDMVDTASVIMGALSSYAQFEAVESGYVPAE